MAPQALLLLNSELVAESASLLAGRVRGKEDAIGEAFRLILGRDPGDREREMGHAFLAEQVEKHRPLAGRLPFRPDYPPALFKDYHKLLPAGRFLRGPVDGWDYFKGKWTGGYEGILNAGADWPPFAFFSMRVEDPRLFLALLSCRESCRDPVAWSGRPLSAWRTRGAHGWGAERCAQTGAS